MVKREAPSEPTVAGKDVMDRIRGAHLLLVEDNYLNLEIARELLASAGVQVTVAGNGREALEKIQTAGLDAVLMDIKMPIMDGYQATRQIRQNPAFHGLPIIALTANAVAGEIEKCRDAGMNDYLSKPIDPDQLYEVLARWVKPGVTTRVATLALPGGAGGATGTVLPSELPGILLAQGLKCALGKADFYRESLIIFLETTEENRAEIGSVLTIRFWQD